ncbi:hypothetical protein DENSPDRAFT_831198 [Dentipellis sp. KUC8613]|nr:hypothetical protein DENSPDRAFT_831198 [Dentipellis sp. KUC8613]
MRTQSQSRGQSRPTRAPARPSPLAAFFRVARTMPSKFNIFRASIYALVLVWSVVCLAIAAHFETILSASDLTRFVPFAIFVSSASILIMLALSAFSLRRNMNPISTRIELACLGLAGTFWLALGAYLASSDSETANVECFASDADTEPIDGGFSTETYQAQYRVLEAFALFNVALVLGFLFLLFGLAMRHYLMGRKQVWMTPVTSYDWFGKGSKPSSRLPPPVTARVERGRSKSRSAPAPAVPQTMKRQYSEKDKRAGTVTVKPVRDQTYIVDMPTTARKPSASRPTRTTRTTERYKPDYYRRDASPRR